ncbi:MAG: tetratricopeptide repeat protein [Armatimonadetes bacterium]|nr:tetratricopeptide repeat protein [Armatimonadota bacterium]
MSSIPRDVVARAKPRRPKAGRGARPLEIRPSKRSKWRAAVLVLVHLIIAVHIAHWLITGRTLTPVEPSEAMQTLEQGWLNVGFILFVILILGTMVFGRFFCGWACHVVAYQDLCGWIMKKIGLKPKPFRSRLLVFVPIFAAFYMFIWPQVVRVWEGRPFPKIVYHLTTDSFWETFPGLWITLLTLGVCGPLIVLFLGNKGFCTYGCPYGAFFGAVDRLAVGKIRVTDACDGCGHCTAMCTSNVRVHEEVKLYGMVVDSGCMKCMDCISVCPKNALYFGFGKTSLMKGRPTEKRRQKKYDFTWAEDLAMVAVFGVSLYAFRGLYNAIPFFLSLGLASITAVLIVQAVRTLYTPNVRMQRVQFRISKRRTRSGMVFLIVSALLTAFVAHSAVLQYHVNEGNRQLEKAQALFDGPGGAGDPVALEAARNSLKHMTWSRRYGLFAVADTEHKLGSIYRFLDDDEMAELHLERAVELDPGLGAAQYALAQVLAADGRMAAAADHLQRATEIDPELPGAQQDLGAALLALDRPQEALEAYEAAVRQNPGDGHARLNLGMLMARLGDLRGGREQIEEAIALEPTLPEAHFDLALVLAQEGKFPEAYEAAGRASELDSDFAAARFIMGRLSLQMGEPERAIEHLSDAKRLSPFDEEIVGAWADAIAQAGRLEETIGSLREPAERDRASAFALAFLYLAAGEEEPASELFDRVRGR